MQMGNREGREKFDIGKMQMTETYIHIYRCTYTTVFYTGLPVSPFRSSTKPTGTFRYKGRRRVCENLLCNYRNTEN